MAKVEIEYGIKRYYDDSGEQLDREDGPAVIYPSGTKYWYRNDVQNSSEYPSDVLSSGRVVWFFDDWIHREGGPALDEPTGFKLWYNEIGNKIWPEL